MPTTFSITATSGRHTLLERSVGMFLAQDYEGEHILLIYNNSGSKQQLPLLSLPSNKKIWLVNNHIDSQTNKPFTSLGAIYNEIVPLIPENSIVTFSDDDDLFLPYHLTEGVKGLVKHNKTGYKPKYSYYRSTEGISLTENTLEPSIFVHASHIKKYGFSLTTTEQHLQWVNPLKEYDELAVDADGVPSLCYNWGDVGIRCYKTSGDYHNPDNFRNYKSNSTDEGDEIITPWSYDQIAPYYKEIENVKNKNM